MLQVINLKKIYKSKNGADVNALDGVTLSFPERGMVFLLGKSGSGKSTLLNVCGGLDMPTEGEIIVKGRSSKEFSQSDFDSYRNTFIGFIFQEYNILNEFSVEDNIALALELQGKSKDKAAIDALLDQVDLKGYAKRKPNTLSGGQKQRIAIARALVKSPEIIMADEPTGALDSNTGKQVFETLKKLSHDKLVIVVSHDRDFAEQYGDRIIELQDGKILSDISKVQIESRSVSDNITTVGEVLCVKRGQDLNDADFEKIKDFLKNSDKDIIIANDEKDVRNFKKVSRINDNGEKEVFRDTDESEQKKKQYTPEDSKFIGSKLPAKHAIKIGLSGLKSKPFRLFLTILLCSAAFILLGLVTTLTLYDSEAAFKETFETASPEAIKIEKQYSVEVIMYSNGEEEGRYDTIYSTRFTEAELEKYKSEFGNKVFGGVTVYSSSAFSLRNNSSKYWLNKIGVYAHLGEDNELRNRITGSYPKAEDEIVLSGYTAEMMIACQAYGADGETINAATVNDLIGKEISLDRTKYKIVGIFDSGEVDPKYEALKTEDNPDEKMVNQYNMAMNDSLHLVAFVSDDALEKISNTYALNYGSSYYDKSIVIAAKGSSGKYSFPEYSNAYYTTMKEAGSTSDFRFFGDAKAQLQDKEVILSENLYYDFFAQILHGENENSKEEPNVSIIEEKNKVLAAAYDIINGETWIYNEETGNSEHVIFTKEELNERRQLVDAYIKKNNMDLSIGLKLFNERDMMAIGDVHEYKIVGTCRLNERLVILSDAQKDTLWNEHKITKDFYDEYNTKYIESPDALYGYIFLPGGGTSAETDVFWDIYTNEEFGADSSKVSIIGAFVGNIRMVDEMVKSLSQVFLIVGIIFAVFAALLLSNFISASISQKKREIGILRAVGARSTDVFKIFFSESFAIAAICVIISTAASFVICGYINSYLTSLIGLSMLSFGVLSIAILLVIAVVTVIVATFLPVYNAARKKPVDSIRAI